MSLISKQTYCFSCKKPEWQEYHFETQPYMSGCMKIAKCNACGAYKKTYSYGAISYYNSKGEEVNFMTNDLRFQKGKK